MFTIGSKARIHKIKEFRQRSIKAMAVLREAPKAPAIILFMLILAAIFADWICLHSPVKGDLSIRFLPPAWMEGGDLSYLLGTDRWGRDVLSRLIYGIRISMIVVLLGISSTGIFGALLGLISGYFGGRVDVIIMRLADIFLAFPGILLGLVLGIVLGPGFINVILIVLIVLWPSFARQVRGEALSIREQDFVLIARAMGVSPWAIMLHHILPNVLPSILILTTLQVGWVIIMEAILAFLGVGIPPPNPSWGVIISEGREYLTTEWWAPLFAIIVLGLTVFSVNMLGDWIRDRVDPKLRQI